jgi:plastocyanin
VRYGFEFTIPLTLRRYFGHREEAATDSASGPVAATVHIQGMAFRPERIEVQRGATIEWRNDDPLPHTVTAADGSFTSPLIEPGRTWRHTFTEPGEYAIHCTPHPFMHSVVVVR